MKALAHLALLWRRFWSWFYNRKYQRRYDTNAEEREHVDKILQQWGRSIKTAKDVEEALKAFNWTSDPLGGLIDWSPSIIAVVLKDFKDDCDGAAALTQYLFSVINIPVTIYALISRKPWVTASHVIAIAYPEDKKCRLYSNGKLVGTYADESSAIAAYRSKSAVEYYDGYLTL
jgi:hypothetical protein